MLDTNPECGADGELCDDEEWIRAMNYTSDDMVYDDVVQMCIHGGANTISTQTYSGRWTRYKQLLFSYAGRDNIDLDNYVSDEQYLHTAALFEPDYYVGRMVAKLGPSLSNRGDNGHHLVKQLQNTIGYHNFQHMYLLNSPICKSTGYVDNNGTYYGKCKNETWIYNQDWDGSYNNPNPEVEDFDCRIDYEDAVAAGCETGDCVFFSQDCYDWENIDYLKEYLGNSLHVAYNYSG